MITREQSDQRLTEVAVALERKYLPATRWFKFDSYNEGSDPGSAIPHCGTAGCAVGQFPGIWLNDWVFDNRTRLPRLIIGSSGHPILDAAFYLGITMDEANHLFQPERQDTNSYGGVVLGDNATREEVAANIRAFIAKRAQVDQ